MGSFQVHIRNSLDYCELKFLNYSIKDVDKKRDNYRKSFCLRQCICNPWQNVHENVNAKGCY